MNACTPFCLPSCGWIDVDESLYEVLMRSTNYEIRRYHPHISASIQTSNHSKRHQNSSSSSSSNPPPKPVTQPYLKLTSYACGSRGARVPNRKAGQTSTLNEKQKMPVILPIQTKHTPLALSTPNPVAMNKIKEHYHITMTFVLPYQYRHAYELPGLPAEQGIEIKEVGPECWAVTTFKGFAGKSTIQRKRDQLLKSLRDKRVSDKFEVSPSEWDIWEYYTRPSFPLFRKTEVAVRVVEI